MSTCESGGPSAVVGVMRVEVGRADEVVAPAARPHRLARRVRRGSRARVEGVHDPVAGAVDAKGQRAEHPAMGSMGMRPGRGMGHRALVVRDEAPLLGRGDPFGELEQEPMLVVGLSSHLVEQREIGRAHV